MQANQTKTAQGTPEKKPQHPNQTLVSKDKMSPEEEEKVKKNAVIQKKIQEARKKLQEKYNNDLMKHLK